MQIFTEEIKGDYILAEWEDDFVLKYENIKQSLIDKGYELTCTECDYLTYYETYSNSADKKVLTILCC